MLYDIMGHTSVRYCQENQLIKEREKLLATKYRFSNQLHHLKIKGKKLEKMYRIDTEVLRELQSSLGLLNLNEKEKLAVEQMKERVDTLQGFDSHPSRPHSSEGLREAPKPIERKKSKWYSRKTLETYGHVCAAEKDKTTAELVGILKQEFNTVYLKNNYENTVLALHKMSKDVLGNSHLFSDH